MSGKKWVGLYGRAQAGKDTVAGLMKDIAGFRRVAFADPLREMALDIDPLVGQDVHLREIVLVHGWEDAKKHPEVRRFLQRLGTDGVRKHIDQDWWVKAGIQAGLDKSLSRGRNRQKAESRVVFTDVRYPNEADAIRDQGGYIVKVVRDGDNPAVGHISESSMTTVEPDYVLDNNGSIDDLPREVHVMMQVLNLF